jgi:hypothetical protein
MALGGLRSAAFVTNVEPAERTSAAANVTPT